MPVILVALVLAVAPAAESPPARLAAAFCEEIVRVAAGQGVDLGPFEDRTGRGAAFALDVRSLVLARLSGRTSLAVSGPRLRIRTVLTETPQRLVASGRAVAEPDGELVDLITASAPTDPTLLALVAGPSRAAPHTIDVIGSVQTPPLAGPVLDLLFLPDERLAVLTPEAVSVYRPDGASLSLEASEPLPGPLDTVRTPGGLLSFDGGLWVLTSRSPEAVLFAFADRGRRLAERRRGAALPFPGSEAGLRYRPGTNLLEAALPDLGDGPFLAARPDPTTAVEADGRLVFAGGHGPRVGAALAGLWPDVLAVASPAPPGREDAILIYDRSTPEARLLDTLPIPGTVRALAATVRNDSARLVAAVEEPAGTRLLVLDLRRAAP